MKKAIIIAIVAACMFAGTVCAKSYADYINAWKVTDAAAIRAAMEDATLPVQRRLICIYRLGQLEDPGRVKTVAGITAVCEEGLRAAGLAGDKWAMGRARDFAKYVAYVQGNAALAAEVCADPALGDDPYVIVYIKGRKGKRFGLQKTDAERKAVLADALPLALQHKFLEQAPLLLNEYIDLTAGDADADVLPVLRRLYRLALPRLADSAWKPFVVQLALALKSRGEEVK